MRSSPNRGGLTDVANSLHYSHTMAPNIKLTYFNGRARAELSRLILAQAAAEYVDDRIEGKDWPAIKPSKFCLVMSYQQNKY
jgi:hypothetical protein